jgi:hypothetical protein
MLPDRRTIPLWLKASFTLFVAVLVPVWWLEYGPANFLWACDIALFVTVIALWRESRLLASMMAVAVLVPELLWNLDFLVRLFAGRDLIGLDATGYMFDAAIPLWRRGLSLFHVFLPLLLLWLVAQLGYHVRAWLVTTALCWLVLPISYLFTDPARNINWVFGLGSAPQTWLPGPVYVAVLMLALPLCVYLPTHLVLKSCLRAEGRAGPACR